MKDRDASPHPGPWRVMNVDSEFAGLVVAVGFLVMGFVSMPIATGFVLGAISLGVVVALLLRFTPKKFTRVALGTVIIREILEHRSAAPFAPLQVLAHLGLARALALNGDNQNSKRAYEEFFTLWKDADPDIPILKEAKAEYAKLM